MSDSQSGNPLPLEDAAIDILGKAQRGRQWSDAFLVERAGISEADLAAIRAGKVMTDPLRRLADVLELGCSALIDAAGNAWRPDPIALSAFQTFSTPFNDMVVNAYLAWDEESGEAVVFDSGADVSDLLDFASSNQLAIRQILITHTHGDHIFDLDRLIEKTGAAAWVGDREPVLAGAQPFAAGTTFACGRLRIETRLTWGHAIGGISYVIHGLNRPVVVVGDAIFAGSMGGGMVSFADALATTRSEILTLPGETVIASGHGPLTTVAEERAHNPFFAI